ncbi:MAG: hypothetical protein D6723_03950 [Acidobacteria bacterium]|nr:MAG: hypothetical protein D6723_03950 [Acidobacteriota bacterium]
MKHTVLIVILLFSLATMGVQSGRVRRGKDVEKSKAAELPFNLDASRPVLVNMTPEEFRACGLNKLSEEELDHLDRWILDLLVKLKSLPEGQNLAAEASATGRVRQEEAELERQRLEARARDLEQRLSLVNREATRMSFDLNQARLAVSRGDWNSAYSLLLRLESSVDRIRRASQ